MISNVTINNNLEVAHDTDLVHTTMAKYIAIDNYTDGCQVTFNNLELNVSHNKYRKTMDVCVYPVEVKNSGIVSRVFDFSQNPLTAGLVLARVPMPRKNQKRLDEAQQNLNGMASHIADLWNKREFDNIKALFS